MTAIPEPTKQNDISILIDEHHERTQEPPRPHLGVSMLGMDCDRAMWLSFRWAVIEKFKGRMLRLFRRGHLEEPTIVKDLRAIGIDIRRTGRDQAHVDFGCHVSGSCDGIIEGGVPEAPKARHVSEFKTHNLKSFTTLLKEGIKKSKPVHHTQIQGYMLGMKIQRGLYVGVCKDDDRYHPERVKLDEPLAIKAVERGQRIAMCERIPEPISTDPTWYKCKWCPCYSFCYETHLTKEVNCRTCAHSTPLDDSTWRCERHDADDIPTDFQRTGCEQHVLHPDLVPWKMVHGDDSIIATYEIDGKQVQNGEPDANVYGSNELIANLEQCVNPDPIVQKAREMFDAKFTDADIPF